MPFAHRAHKLMFVLKVIIIAVNFNSNWVQRAFICMQFSRAILQTNLCPFISIKYKITSNFCDNVPTANLTPLRNSILMLLIYLFFLLLTNRDADVKRPNGGRVQDARFRIIVNY